MRRISVLVRLCVTLVIGSAALGCDDKPTANPDEAEPDDDLGDGKLSGSGPGGVDQLLTKADPAIVEAEALLADGKAERALARIDAAIAENPDNARFHYVRGNALTYLDRDADARAAYQQAIALDDTDALPHAGLGSLLAFGDNATQADREAAIAHFQAALALDPSLAPAHQALGNVLISLGQLDAAVEALETADRLGGNVETDYLLAQAYGELGKLEPAIAHAKSAIEYEPEASGVDIRLLHARLLAEAGQTDEAAAEFERAAKLVPDSPPLRLEVVRGLLELGEPAAAMVHMQWLLEAAPDQPPVLVNHGRILVALGQPKDALVEFDRALAIQPDSQAAQTYRIEALVAGKRCKDARAQFDALAKQLGWVKGGEQPLPRALVKAQGFLDAGKCK